MGEYKANIYLIGDRDTVLGFRFAGLQGHTASDAPAAMELFQRAVEDKRVRILVLTERIADLIRPTLDAFEEKNNFPFVVEIPDGSGPSPSRRSPSEIVRKAIGISI
jgi:vacuolar-type H+-ATPase subunit F/Vma7